MKCRTGVGGVLCAAHRDRATGTLHGHTWEITAWFSDGDALVRQAELVRALSVFDHRELPAAEAWAEPLGRAILLLLPDALSLELRRPAERLYAEVER